MPTANRYYLDTSAIVKRYVLEEGTPIVDEIFINAYKGLNEILFSYWNVAETAVVFDKYQNRLKLNSHVLMKNFLREISTLLRLNRLRLIMVDQKVLGKSIDFIFKYHIYVADALQIASAANQDAVFVTADRKLAENAKKEGLKVLFIVK